MMKQQYHAQHIVVIIHQAIISIIEIALLP